MKKYTWFCLFVGAVNVAFVVANTNPQLHAVCAIMCILAALINEETKL